MSTYKPVKSKCSHDHFPQISRHMTFMLDRLRRVFILFNGKHGLNEYDRQMLARLSDLLFTGRGTQPWTIQSVITKADTIPSSDMRTAIASIRKQIQEAAPMCLPPIITSIEMNPAFGIDQVRENIVDACGIGRVTF
jgi:GTP-binding protein